MPPCADKLGRPIHDLRISVTDRCNFRCPYCMPAELYGEDYEFLPKADLLSFEEIERLARLFVDLGVEKLRITGGEPLLRHGLPRLIERLAAIPGQRDIALTTNGYLLESQAAALREAGLERVTVSLDSFDEAVFERMSGRSFGPQRVIAGIDAAKRAGIGPIKINCVVQRGVNDHTLVDLARAYRGTGHIVRFIEYMDVGTLNGWDLSQVVTAAEIVERIGAEFPIEPVDRNYRGEVANRYRYRDGSGEIGIIASVSEPFCGECTRARLTIEGKLVTCLFAADGVDLRAPMRAGASDDELRKLIEDVWTRRTDRYSEERAELTARGDSSTRKAKIEMYQIGG
ncbi:MAG: GTP 3',8-cyclase MoaA [Deltaproteobacteria bacterium]|nr:GTP 3',8-cyclase MoaA [Deltaproteobacteria bacterium]